MKIMICSAIGSPEHFSGPDLGNELAMLVFFPPLGLLRWVPISSSQEVCGAVILPEVVSVRPHAETGPMTLWAFFFLKVRSILFKTNKDLNKKEKKEFD